MLNRKSRRKIKKLLYKLNKSIKQLLKLSFSGIKKLLYQLLRLSFIFNRKNKSSSLNSSPKTLYQKTTLGFILPTAMLVLIVVSLVVMSILFRTEKRTAQVSADRQESIVYNVATPAIERAKSKIEYLFKRDPSFPSGVPAEDKIQELMLDSLIDANDNDDDYTLTDETRLDLNSDGSLDNAWSFDTDLDGDGVNETVAYSILFLTEIDTDADNVVDFDINSTDLQKAK